MDMDAGSVDLLDSDLIKIREIWRKLNNKYATRRNTKQNLLDLVHDAEDQFRQIGFEITVGMSRQIAWAMGVEAGDDAPDNITFSLEGRADQEEFDHDRMAWEAKHRLIDDDAAKRFLGKGGTEDQRLILPSSIDAPEKQKKD